MNVFPHDYVRHNLPLIVLSGLNTETTIDPDHGTASRPLLLEGGFRIKTELPSVTGPLAERLLHALLASDAGEVPWNGRGSFAKDHGGIFTFRAVGRVGQTHLFPASTLFKFSANPSDRICQHGGMLSGTIDIHIATSKSSSASTSATAESQP